MTEKDNAVRAANLALAEKILGNFGRSMDGWYEDLHQDAVLEFPFGALVGIPPRLEGKEACAGMFSVVAAKLKLQFSEIKIQPLLDPNVLLAEYRGKGGFGGKVYDQRYITILGFKDGKLIFYREHMDTAIVSDVVGHLSAMAG